MVVYGRDTASPAASQKHAASDDKSQEGGDSLIADLNRAFSDTPHANPLLSAAQLRALRRRNSAAARCVPKLRECSLRIAALTAVIQRAGISIVAVCRRAEPFRLRRQKRRRRPRALRRARRRPRSGPGRRLRCTTRSRRRPRCSRAVAVPGSGGGGGGGRSRRIRPRAGLGGRVRPGRGLQPGGGVGRGAGGGGGGGVGGG